MKKLDGYAAELIKDIIRDGDSLFGVEGKKHHLTLTGEAETAVREDVEADSELKQKLLQAKKK